MDRIEFLHELEVKGIDFTDMVISSFDQFMALYSLVGHFETKKIQNDTNLTFTISFGTMDEVNRLYAAIHENGGIINIYERTFSVTVLSINNNKITITIS